MPTARACTKLIIAGEHLVVHGFRGLAIPIHQYYTEVKVTSSDTFKVTTKDQSLLPYLNAEVINIIEDLGVDPNLVCHINFNATPGLGLGVSASFAVATIRALTGNTISEADLLHYAGLSEQRNHGKTSGIDHTTIVLDRPYLLNSDLTIENTDLFSTIELINTGVPKEPTKEMVSFVSKNKNLDTWTTLDQEFPNLINAINLNDTKEFIRIINLYGENLENLGVVTKEATNLAKEYRAKGYGVKICGAGGRTNGSGIMMLIKP